MADAPPPTTTTAATSEPPEPVLFPNLPNDVGLQCLARVPRGHHPSVSLVCKSWLEVLRSPLFFSLRQSLNVVDSILYLNLRLTSSSAPSPSPTPSFKWFILFHPNPSSSSSSSSSPSPKKTLIPIPPPPTFQPVGASIVALGSKIYIIGGSVDEIPTRTMLVFDTVLNRWEMHAPQMRIAREFAAAGAVNGKIYVMGGCRVNKQAMITNWAEVFDPETGSWAPVPSPDEVREGIMHACAVAGGKIFAMADRGGVVFDPASGEWGPVPKRLDMGWRGRAGVVGAVVYCYDYLGKIRGFDLEENVWKELRGLERSLPGFLCGATMANAGGRLVVAWEDKKVNGSRKEMEVRCAEIQVWKDGETGELWGSIAWTDVILVAPAGSLIVNCLAVGL